MPMMPYRNCAQPGCGELVRGKGRCPQHAKQQRVEHNARRTPADYGRKWRRVRDAFITRNPICSDCAEQGKTKVAQVVHHIIPLDQGGTNAFSNLMSLCTTCHEKKHKRFSQ